MRPYCCTLLLLCLTNWCLAEEPAQWLIKVQIKSENPQAKPNEPKMQVLSEPQVTTLDGREFTFQVGQQVAMPEEIANKEEPATLGTRIHGRVKKAQAANHVWIDLSMKLSEWVQNPQDKQEITIHAQETRVIKLLPTQQVYKVELPQRGNAQSWIEINVEQVEAIK